MKLHVVCSGCGGAGNYYPVLNEGGDMGSLTGCDECQGQGSYEAEALGPEDIEFLHRVARVLGICNQTHTGAKVEALIDRLTPSGDAPFTPGYSEPQVEVAVRRVIGKWFDAELSGTAADIEEIIANLKATLAKGNPDA